MKTISRVFRALADPTRRQILQELKAGEMAAGEIASRFTISGPSISRHLSILKSADLVSERREANRILYRLEPEEIAGAVGDFLSAVCPTQVLHGGRRKRKEGGHIMRIAITGGTGFVGGHFAKRVLAEGHQVVLLSRKADRLPESGEGSTRITRVSSDLSDVDVLAAAFAGCDAVAHCAGINREIGRQTYQRIHIDGTRNVVEAAKRAGVRRIALMSFLRARPDCGSPYHVSEWAAEEVVHQSSLQYTIVKAGMVYGRGDHMLDHLSHAFYTLPIFSPRSDSGKRQSGRWPSTT